MKRRLCAAAVCAAFGAGGLLSSSALAQSALDRAVSTGVLAGLDRAMKTPLEIVWLRAAADEALWNQAEFSGTKPIGRTAWRYVFGGSAQYAPPPNQVARLVVSTLNLPQGSLAAGRLDLRGTGRLYIVTPESAKAQSPAAAAPDKLAMILAAGSTLTVTDALSPAIRVEIKAPDSEPMLLGNLAASDLRKALALLVKPGSASALEAGVNDHGRVALQGGGAVQLAALLPSADLPVRLAKAPAVEAFMTALASPAIAPARPAPRQAAGPVAPDVTHDFVAFAAVPALPQAQFEPVALAALPSFNAPRPRAVRTERRVVPTTDFPVEIAAPSADAPITLAALAVTAFPQPAIAASSVQPGPAPRPSVPVPVEAAMTTSKSEPMTLAALAPATFDSVAMPPRNAAGPRAEATLEFAVDVSAAAVLPAAHPVLAALAPRGVEPAAHDKATPADSHPVVAMAAPIADSLEFKAPAKSEAPAAQKEDLAQMRAEIEAEIERERERLAAQFKPQVIGAPAKRFVLGV